jgi:serine protease Do
MTKKRLLYLTLIVATLTIGVVIGTIVSRGVKAGEQKAQVLVIPDPVSLSNAFSQIAANLDPAVVNISTESIPESPIPINGRNRNNRNPNQDPRQGNPFGDLFDFFGAPDQPNPNQKVQSLGTGFIVDKAGYILTNRHVVDKATKITVRLDDKSEYTAKVIGSDEPTDLDVVKIDVGHDLAVAKMGNSDAVKVGDWVLAIGSPFSLDHTVTAGIISAKGRTQLPGSSGNDFQSFLQTDAAINPGNSGGPLVNMAGEVIGINTAIISETRQSAGLGFALPSNAAVKVYNQLIQGGKVTRGGIGITYQAGQSTQTCRSFGLKPECGVVITTVTKGGPAEKSGLREDDVIIEIDGVSTPTGSALLDVVANSPVGKTIRIKINRDGKELTIPVTIVDRNEINSEVASNPGGGGRGNGNGNDQGESSAGKLGIRVQSITPDMARQLRLNSSDGVYVASVDQDSAAEDAGIQRGTIITRMITCTQRYDIRNVEDFRRAERVLKSGMDVAFRVLTANPTTREYRSGLVPITIP